MDVQLPSNYAVDELPKSVKLTNPDQDIIFQRQVEYDKTSGTIRCLLQLQFKKSLYDADMYEMVKEMYKRLFNYLKEPVVLKRL